MSVQNVQYITLRSLDRNAGSDGRATFRIPQRSLPSDYSLFFVNAQIPITFYYIEAPNNVFVFRETGGLTQDASFTITPGSYSSQELASLLETEMTAVSPNTNTYTVTYDFATGKMTFATGSADTVQFQNTMALKLFLAIGFYDANPGVGYTIRDNIDGTSITSPSYCQAGPSTLILESNLRCQGYHTQSEDIDTMAVIPMTGGPGDYVSYEPNNRVELFAQNDHGQLSTIILSIRRDDTGEYIGSFNGAPWTVTIAVRGHNVE